MPRIHELFAFIAEEHPGDEGVIAANLIDPEMLAPLMGADFSRVESLMPIAQKLCNQYGREVKLVRFSTRTVLQTLKPKTS